MEGCPKYFQVKVVLEENRSQAPHHPGRDLPTQTRENRNGPGVLKGIRGVAWTTGFQYVHIEIGLEHVTRSLITCM